MFVDTRGVSEWLVFEHKLRQFTPKLGQVGVEHFIVTPKNVFVFGADGVGVVETLTPWAGKVLPAHSGVGSRWGLTSGMVQAQFEVLDDTTMLGNIIPLPSFLPDGLFANKDTLVKISWGKEAMLVDSLTTPIFQRLMSSRLVVGEPEPVCVNPRPVLRKG